MLHSPSGPRGSRTGPSGSVAVWPTPENADALPDDNGLIDDRPALPGAALAAEHQPQAVIRTASSADPSIPVPAVFHEIDEHGAQTPGEKISKAIYQLQDTDSTYIMSRLPQQAEGGTAAPPPRSPSSPIPTARTPSPPP